MAWLSIDIPTKLPIEYFVCIPAFSMLVAIVYDSRTAFYMTVTMALLMAGIRGNDFDSGIAMLFAGTLAAYTVRDIQSRTQMYQSIFYILIAFLIAVTAISLERSSEFLPIINKLAITTLNAILSPLITFGLLFILERFTHITTDLRLQEFEKLNHPLLQKLSDIAPGTYQHTLSVAMLAEKCATAINANPLLTKVGTYFHDIGKMKRSQYFVENQSSKESKHEKLSPTRSAETIKSHVLEGIKLAQQYKLPQRIIDFIPMHHGTSLIKHFYAMALEEAQESNTEIDEKTFRYPGPKPQTKETALLMICDSAEAMSRRMGGDQKN